MKITPQLQFRKPFLTPSDDFIAGFSDNHRREHLSYEPFLAAALADGEVGEEHSASEHEGGA